MASPRSPPKIDVMRRMKVDLPQPESAAMPITTGLTAVASAIIGDTAARDATMLDGIATEPGENAEAARERVSMTKTA